MVTKGSGSKCCVFRLLSLHSSNAPAKPKALTPPIVAPATTPPLRLFFKLGEGDCEAFWVGRLETCKEGTIDGATVGTETSNLLVVMRIIESR